MAIPQRALLKTLERHSNFGHKKREAAFVRQVSLACSSAGMSLAKTASRSSNGSMADLMSLYRFLNNPKITISELRKIRAEVVLDLSADTKEVVVIHDVTQLDFTKHNSKIDRRLIGDHDGRGYEYVACLAVDFESSQFLGVLHDTVVNQDGPDDAESLDYNYEKLFRDFSPKEQKRLKENHRHQMAVHINALSGLLKGRDSVHVADCEFDDIFILHQCVQHNVDFVIRTNATRSLEVPLQNWINPEMIKMRQAGHPRKEGWVCLRTKDVVDSLPLQFFKELSLDSLGRITSASRAARSARLFIGAIPVRLYRYAKRNKRYIKTPAPVEVNLVVIREMDPPADCDPLCWVLFTSLPIGNHDEICKIAEIYKRRWAAEEFFRLIKSGFQIEDSRTANSSKIAKQLIVLCLAAMIIFDLKKSLNLTLKGRLSDHEYNSIKYGLKNLNNPHVDVRLRLFCLIVKLGGWYKRRGDPIGPAVLMRGVLQVFALMQAVSRYPNLLIQASSKPEILAEMFGFRIT